MFSFFRKSKKDLTNQDNASGSNSNKKVSKDTKEGHSPTQVHKDMCKNKLKLEKLKCAAPLPSSNVVPNETSLVETSTIACNNKKSNEIIISELKPSEVIEMDPSKAHSYASMLKPKEPSSSGTASSNRTSVKPCGHGTVAIAPRIPISSQKREKNTPPGSPNFEITKKEKLEFKTPPTSPIGSPNFKIKTKNKSDSSLTSDKTINSKPSTSSLVPNKSANVHLNDTTEAEKKNLINQETKFQSQLNDLSKQLSVRDAEANKLQFQLEELGRDVFAKSAGMDRLQAELSAAHKECEATKTRIRHLETDVRLIRENNDELTDELKQNTESYMNNESEAKAKIAELEEVIKNLQARISTLGQQLDSLKQEKEVLEQQHKELQKQREVENRIMSQQLEQATQQKAEGEKKWKEEFEKMRTVNIMKEQQLLDDFEWKLREVQQICKKRLEDKEKNIEERMKEAYEQAETKMKEAEAMLTKVESLKSYEMEVEKLRGITKEQERSMKELSDKQEQMKVAEESLKSETKRLRNMIEMEKENLQHMQRMHHQDLLDKERKLQQVLNEKRSEIAMYWEEKLLHEVSRLKDELEQIYTEDKYYAVESLRKEKDSKYESATQDWENRINACLKEIENLKEALEEKDKSFQDEITRKQTDSDREMFEIRRLMDKIDMVHYEKFENLSLEHDREVEILIQEKDTKIKEIELDWQQKVFSLEKSLEVVKEKMEKESNQKLERLIEQHRSELDEQWANLIYQKQEAIKLVEHEYVTKYKTLEEQFLIQQKSHASREIELLKTIDSLKNELESRNLTIDDLQNNVDTLEGGIQVLNQEIAQQGDNLAKNGDEANQRIKNLEEKITKLQQDQEKEREDFRLKILNKHKESQTTIENLQKRCNCLTKLFEEVRQRYERRESRQEDLNTIADLRQVIAEQEKDLACMNEEKRFYQMRLLNLEKLIKGSGNESEEEEDAFQDAVVQHKDSSLNDTSSSSHNGLPPPYPHFAGATNIQIPPTILECDDCDE